MSRNKANQRANAVPEPIDIDGDEQVIANAEAFSNAVEVVVNAPTPGFDEQSAPLYPGFLAGPKTLTAAGDGPDGRPWVYSRSGTTETGIRRERQGDAVRPRCPACTRDEVAVLCHATSSKEVTRYRCPICTFRTEKLRPEIAKQMRAGSYSPPNNRPFVERP